MTKIPLMLGKKNKRSCDGCTKCCEGWLTATIHGEDMYPGKPCQNCEPGKGCTDYKNRPDEPCKNYMCLWRAEDVVPLEFKPSEVNSLITRLNINGMPYLALVEAGEKIRAEVVAWFIVFVSSKGINAEWQIDGRSYFAGSPQFLKAVEDRDRQQNKR
jgi:hypothetical protein